ncbi:MAG: FtsQ-type POTRA domain-containing protein [Clostridiales bacterium]|nr:FtsQ-type POTRA domain-containing protein [Clostridiales bacterium]
MYEYVRKDINMPDYTQYHRHKRRAGNFKWILAILFLSICVACGYLFSISPFFGVEQIMVSGNKLVSNERLRALSGIGVNQNIFSVDTAWVEQRLTIDPMVAGAKVECALPRTVKIAITERQPVAILATGQAFVQIDENGLVLCRSGAWDNYSLPIISGVKGFHPGVIAGSRIDSQDMQVALNVLLNLPEQAFPAVREINVTDNQKIRLYTEGGIEVRVGDKADMAKKYLLADSIIYNEHLNGNLSRISYIDISSTEKPVICPLYQ